MPKSKKPTTIQFNEFTRTDKQLGSNPGGFFKHNVSGKQYYIKWLPEHLLPQEKQFFNPQDLLKDKYKNRHRNRFNNEVLAARIYELYGVAVPKMEFVTFVDEYGVTNYGIASEKKEGITMIRDAGSDFQQVCSKAQEDFLLDVLLSNYDVVGLGMDNMFYDSQTKDAFRLDPGAALRYYAQGKPKKGEFNAAVGEFEDMESGVRKNTQFHPSVLAQAGSVFNGVYDSPALLVSLKKLLSVSDEQLIACIEDNGFNIDESGKGQKKNEAIIVQLLERKQTLIAKAEEKILNRLIHGLSNTAERSNYLRQAGLEEAAISNICTTIQQSKSKVEVGVLIKAAIKPAVQPEVVAIPPAVETVPTKNAKIKANAEALIQTLNLEGVKIILRVENYIPGNELHNYAQPVQKVQFGFKIVEDRNRFAESITTIAGQEVIVYLGFGKEQTPQPIVQLNPNFVAAYKAPVKPSIEGPKVDNFDFSDEEKHFNQIIRDFLHSRASEDNPTYAAQYPGNTGPDQIQRVKHGGMHSSRTALHTTKIISLLEEAGYAPGAGLTARDQFLIKIAALFHDTGRGNDSGSDKEIWEHAGAEFARKWLEERGFTKEEVDKVYEAIAHKDSKEVQAKNVYALVLAGSDSLDWVRSHSSTFNAKFMPDIIRQYIPEATLTHLGFVAKKIATIQGDSPREHMGVEGNFSIATKKTFEHNAHGCYSAIKAGYLQFASELDQIKNEPKPTSAVPSVAVNNTAVASITINIESAQKPQIDFPLLFTFNEADVFCAKQGGTQVLLTTFDAFKE